MIRFPSTAFVGRILPKEAFFKQLTLSAELREKFVSDVRRIRVEYSLTASSINVDPTDELTEILILSIQLKRQDYDKRIVEAIARQNTHQIVFISFLIKPLGKRSFSSEQCRSSRMLFD